MNSIFVPFEVQPDERYIKRLDLEYNSGAELWMKVPTMIEALKKNDKAFDSWSRTNYNLLPQLSNIGSKVILKLIRDEESKCPDKFKPALSMDVNNAESVAYFAEKTYDALKESRIQEYPTYQPWSNPLPWISLNPDRLVLDGDLSGNTFSYLAFGNKGRSFDLRFTYKRDPHAPLSRILRGEDGINISNAYLFRVTEGSRFTHVLVLKLTNVPRLREHPLYVYDPVSILVNGDTEYIYHDGTKDISNSTDIKNQYPGDTEKYISELAYLIISKYATSRIIILDDKHNLTRAFMKRSDGTISSDICIRYALLRKYLVRYGRYYNIPVYTNNKYSLYDCIHSDCKSSIRLDLDGNVECKECDYKSTLLKHILTKLARINVHKGSDEATRLISLLKPDFFMIPNCGSLLKNVF